jgi:inward rectifier potassium channel
MNRKYRATFNKDGLTATRRIGINHFALPEIYNSLVTMSWLSFFSFLFLAYFCLSLIFTFAYSITGFHHFNGLQSTEVVQKFWEVFLYNAQTLSTVGGAGIAPVGMHYNLILTIESMVAMLCMAIITGLLYVRFSRPSAEIICSENALVSPYKDGNALMIRIMNAKKNELVELTVTASLVKNDLVTHKREVKVLTLERPSLSFLAHPWTIVHPITKESPLYNFDWCDSDKIQYDLSFWFNGIDRTTGHNVFLGRTYFLNDVVHNAKFLPCLEVDDEGVFIAYLGKVGDYEKQKD